MLDRGALDPDEVGVAVVGAVPLGSQLAGEVGAKRRLVDVAGRLGLAPEGSAALRRGQAEPVPISCGASQVGGYQVGMQGRIAGARRAVAKGHRDQTRAGLDRLAPRAALHEAGVALQVGDSLGDSVVVGPQDSGPDLGGSDRVEQGDRLRRGEADVVAEDRLDPALAATRVGVAARLGAAHQHFAADRVPAGEDRGVGIAVNLAGEAELSGQLADPLTRRLARFGVVVLAAFGHRLDPVVGVSSPDLRHSHHRLRCPLREHLASGELPSSQCVGLRGLGFRDASWGRRTGLVGCSGWLCWPGVCGALWWPWLLALILLWLLVLADLAGFGLGRLAMAPAAQTRRPAASRTRIRARGLALDPGCGGRDQPLRTAAQVAASANTPRGGFVWRAAAAKRLAVKHCRLFEFDPPRRDL